MITICSFASYYRWLRIRNVNEKAKRIIAEQLEQGVTVIFQEELYEKTKTVSCCEGI